MEKILKKIYKNFIKDEIKFEKIKKMLGKNEKSKKFETKS